MKFDYSFITLGHYIIFEPMIIVSNTILLVLSLLFMRRLMVWPINYARSMAAFMLMLGCSAIFGAICHSVHFQNGKDFFELMFFFMNAFSLLSAFFCFKATYLYDNRGKRRSPWLLPLAIGVTCALLAYSFLLQQFVLVKLVAGATLVYTLIVHIADWRKTKREGSLYFIYAVASSFLSIVVHSAHISFHEWFNYKDFAHVFMILAMVMFYKGGMLNSRPGTSKPGL